MEIGIIGVSGLTFELALRSVEAGYKVKIHNPQGNNLIRDVVKKGAEIQLTTLEDAANMQIVVLLFIKMI